MFAFVYKLILRTRSRVFEKILLKIRAIMLKISNPMITLEYRGFRLKMPFSHTIFYYQKLYPNYDMWLHRIGSYIMAKQGTLKMIDVGANIGDTAVFMNIPQAKYLLIEGERSYVQLIKENLALNYAKWGGV